MKSSIFVVLSVMLLVLAGCGAKEQPATQQPTQEAKQTTAQAPKLTGAAAELQGLMAGKQKLEYQITYDVVSRTAGQETKSTMIQYFDGANRMRTDVTVKGVSEARTYVMDGAVTLCAKVNNRWGCNAAEVQADASKEAEQDIAQGTSAYTITADGTKQLLGKTHTCYKIADAPNSVTMRYCFSGDGVPVYISTESPQATTEMTALLYGLDVAETVWALPG
jgi:hypothetical protein